jgi:hypothetical protein
VDTLGVEVSEDDNKEKLRSEWAEKLSSIATPASTREEPAKAVPKVKTGNERLAAQALELLVNLNDMVCGGLMIVGFHGTAMAISAREDAFREQAMAALLADPGLCRKLTEKAKVAGPLGLLLAYGMLGIGIAPVAATEYQDMRARAEEKKRNRE